MGLCLLGKPANTDHHLAVVLKVEETSGLSDIQI